MATKTKTLLDGVNETAKLGRIIQGETDAFTALTSDHYQVEIDTIVKAINRVNRLVFENKTLIPDVESTGTITLVAGQRVYGLPANYEKMKSCNLHNRTLGTFIRQYAGDYDDLVNAIRQPNNRNGRPNYWVVDPTTSYSLYFDSIPTSEEAGEAYEFRYRHTVLMEAHDDTFPYSDEVFDILVPAFKEVWSQDAKKSFNQAFFTTAVGDAIDVLRGTNIPDRY